jgi:hypothetical protein
MESLEHLLDGYLGKMFYSKKKQKGVSSQGAEFGCDYVSSLIGVLLEWGFGFYKLRCEVPLNNTGRNFGGIKLSLYNQNTNSARVLELHDLVVAIPDLKISCEAAAHLDSIDYLRGKESSQERYLGLIGAQKK